MFVCEWFKIQLYKHTFRSSVLMKTSRSESVRCAFNRNNLKWTFELEINLSERKKANWKQASGAVWLRTILMFCGRSSCNDNDSLTWFSQVLQLIVGRDSCSYSFASRKCFPLTTFDSETLFWDDFSSFNRVLKLFLDKIMSRTKLLQILKVLHVQHYLLNTATTIIMISISFSFLFWCCT